MTKGQNSILVYFLVPILLFAFSFAIYYNTLEHGYVFDDPYAILKNRDVNITETPDVLSILKHDWQVSPAFSLSYYSLVLLSKAKTSK